MKNTSPSSVHTPGPWTVACDSYGKVQHSKKACVFAGLGSGHTPFIAQRIKNWADAHLIAAGPELLGIAQDVLDWMDTMVERKNLAPGWIAIEKGLRAAIAKAKGR